jgi:hypothetical protein
MIDIDVSNMGIRRYFEEKPMKKQANKRVNKSSAKVTKKVASKPTSKKAKVTKIGQFQKVTNKQRKTSAAKHYHHTFALNETTGEMEHLLLTDHGYKTGRERAIRNPEDLPESSFYVKFRKAMINPVKK